MKKFLALVLAVLLVVSFSVVAHAEPCTHPLQNIIRTDRTIIAYNISGHTVRVTQLIECVGCGEVFEVFLRNETASHTMEAVVYNYGHDDSKPIHHWLFEYACCGSFSVQRPCSGPPCPTAIE